MYTFKTLGALALIASVQAIITPTSPDSNTVVKVGDKIEALWTVDPDQQWKDVEIQLMTGDNFNMIPLATIATGIDGTTASSYSFNAPEVTPNAKIYFLQFTNGGNMSDPTWTTRFTIAAADGTTTEPTNSTDYSGNTVQWGTGTLVGAVSTDSSASGSNSTSAAVSASGASTSAAVANSTSASASAMSSTAESATSAAAASSASASATSARSSGTAAAAAASSSKPASGAGRVQAGLGMMLVVGLATVALL
ncbi:hypothetical protein IAU60_001961 [Kwoniella sp. DSM 27419]